MTFPANIQIGYHSYSEGAPDVHGNPVPVYTPPLNASGTPLMVIDLAPYRGKETSETRVIGTVKIHARPDCPLKAKDVVDIPQGQFEVDEDIEDQTLGFHGWNPGIVVWVKRIQG